MELPQELQLAPLFGFASLPGNKTEWMGAGNFYGVLPYEGRYDAMIPTFFSYDAAKAGFSTASDLPAIEGEIRDAKWINVAGGKKILILARNNKGLIFLKPTDE
jgi:enediyne biosynthesis protein E4